MKKVLIGLAPVLFLTFASPVFAHPGRTDSSGCHTCRTNCPDWGLSYGEYHCHGGSVYVPSEPVKYESIQPTSTPTIKPTTKPTVKPTFIPSPTPTESPTPSPEVLSVTNEPSPTPEVKGDSDSGDGWGWLTLPGGLIGWIFWKYRHTFGGTNDVT